MKFKGKHILRSILISSMFLPLCVISVKISAQPTGGPYGPLPAKYEIPEAGTIYYVSPDGKAEAAGTVLSEPTNLETAISRVLTGDAIILRGGVYRTGELEFNQGITMQAYEDEQPVLKGTLVASEGVAVRGGVWRIPWKTLFPVKPLPWWQKDREGARTPIHRFNNDMVFIDGESLISAGWPGEVDDNSYYIDYEKEQIFVGVNPAEHLVEITAWNGGLTRKTTEVHGKISDKKGPIIRGITFTQYAWRAIEIEGKRSFGPHEEMTDEPYGPQDPSSYGKEVTGTTLENVTITHCSRVAGFFRGDGLTISQSLFSHTSTEGVYIIGSSDVLLEGNIFGTNNVEMLTGYYPSAVKIFNQSHRVTVRNNLVMDNPNSSGVWWDVGNRDGVFMNNWVQNCENGFFFEISDGAICVGNVFVDCVNGILVLNSANVRAWHNTLVNCSARFARNNRRAGGHFGWHAATGPDWDERFGHAFMSNLLVAGDQFGNPLLQVDQSRDLCGELSDSPMDRIDGNVYVSARKDAPLFRWSPLEGENCSITFSDIKGFSDINKDFEARGKVLPCPIRSVFMSPELKNYDLLDSFSEQSAVPLSDEIIKLTGWKDKKVRMPGANPFGM